MTISSSGCACGMMVKALIQRFFRGKGVRGTLACSQCANAPIPLETGWLCGASQKQDPKWSCAFLPTLPTRELRAEPIR